MAIGNAIKKKINSFKCKLAHYAWELAFIDYSEDVFYKTDKLRNYHKVKNPYKDKWFADPFILDANEKEIKLLVEEFDYNVNRGRIAILSIDRKTWTITDCKIILDLPTHLSFPVIYRKDGKVYVHPENSASGKSFIYLYDETTDTLQKPIELFDEPLTDAIFYEHEDELYLLTTKVPTPNGSVLSVYKFDKDFKHEHIQDVNIVPNRARMAGYVISTKDADIRPSQNCDGGYGKEVIFQEILIKDGSLSFNDTGRLLPPSKKYHGLHTYNSFKKELVVIDLKKYDNPMIYRFIQWLKTVIH